MLQGNVEGCKHQRRHPVLGLRLFEQQSYHDPMRHAVGIRPDCKPVALDEVRDAMSIDAGTCGEMRASMSILCTWSSAMAQGRAARISGCVCVNLESPPSSPRGPSTFMIKM